MPEARLEDSGSGQVPAGDGWFVLNVRDARWLTWDARGSLCSFESPESEFSEFGFRLHVLPPGQPNGLYHSEQAQEDFLVLSGECRLLVEGEERSLRAWDFFHAPAGTEHIFVGAGEEPCVILMAGTRPADEQLRYPVSELAARHGASAERETTDPDEAYAPLPLGRWGRPPCWEVFPGPDRLHGDRRQRAAQPQPAGRISESDAAKSAGMSAPGA